MLLVGGPLPRVSWLLALGWDSGPLLLAAAASLAEALCTTCTLRRWLLGPPLLLLLCRRFNRITTHRRCQLSAQKGNSHGRLLKLLLWLVGGTWELLHGAAASSQSLIQLKPQRSHQCAWRTRQTPQRLLHGMRGMKLGGCCCQVTPLHCCPALSRRGGPHRLGRPSL